MKEHPLSLPGEIPEPYPIQLSVSESADQVVEEMGRRVLITGGAGFIGSHTCLVLLEQGHELVVLDNFDNSNPEALKRVQELSGSTQLTLVRGDVRDPSALDQAFTTSGVVDGVIHFADGKPLVNRSPTHSCTGM